MKHALPIFAALLLAPSVCAQTWQPVALVSKTAKLAGHSGGEGGQWPRALVCDASGKFVLFGTDVGGLFRSLDGGSRWEPCNVGYTPRGTSGLAIDPHDSRRVLSIGANSAPSDFHGVWLSTDGASSWRQVFPVTLCGTSDNRGQLAFDPATFDAKRQLSRVIYWSRIADDKLASNDKPHPALYKSLDGGATWAEIPNTAQIGGSEIRVHPTHHVVYAANKNGAWRSADGGKSWTKTLDGDVTGIDVSPAAPPRVWATKADGVYLSRDEAKTWAKLAGSEKIVQSGTTLRNVKVCPSNPQKLVLWREGANYQWPRFASSDGGATWTEAKKDATLAFLPDNARQGLFVWHPKNANIVWSVGGDWPTKSADGGKTYAWSGDGDNGLLIGGAFQFNAQNPDILFFGSQDYNGALTVDGGKTWTYQNPAGNGWGGFTYGGYAASDKLLFVGNAAGWGAPRKLRVSRDGGATWTETPHVYAGPDAAFGDPTDPQVLFASNLRSSDGGQTWTAMPNCDAVLTAANAMLYGKRGDALVQSSDKGATWTETARTSGGITDIAIDSSRGKIYVVSGDALKIWQNGAWKTVENLSKDQWGGNRVASVAVDPTNPTIVYLACHRDLFSTNAAVLRSTDAGATWTNLTVNAPLKPGQRDGGREAIWVRVHPKTRAAWVATSCYGLWKIGPPR